MQYFKYIKISNIDKNMILFVIMLQEFSKIWIMIWIIINMKGFTIKINIKVRL